MLSFVKCANDPGDPWVACMGIPRDALLLQEGDSSE